MITGIASDGVYDLLFQYLKLKLGFTTKDLVRCLTGLCARSCHSSYQSWLLDPKPSLAHKPVGDRLLLLGTGCMSQKGVIRRSASKRALRLAFEY